MPTTDCLRSIATAFLMFLGGCAADVEPNAPVDPSGVDTGIAIEHQADTQICWAAVTQGLLSYAGVERSQCEIVGQVFGRECCTSTGALEDSCNVGYHMPSLAPMLDYNSTDLFAVSPDALQRAFVRGEVLVLRYSGVNWAHVELVSGYGAAAGCNNVDDFAIWNSSEEQPEKHCVPFEQLLEPAGGFVPEGSKLTTAWAYHLQ